MKLYQLSRTQQNIPKWDTFLVAVFWSFVERSAAVRKENNDSFIFRSLIVSLRKESGLTQVELANRLKKPQSFVSKYEHGERRLDFVELVEVLDSLGLSIQLFADRFEKARKKN